MNKNNFNKWVTVWGNAMSISDRRPENYARNLTLRYPIFNVFNGSAIRVTLDNFTGTQAVTISKVVVSKMPGNADNKLKFPGDKIEPQTLAAVTFAGKKSVTIEPGKDVVSDEIKFAVNEHEWLAVSLYLEDFTQMRSSVIITGPLSGGYYSVGDFTESVSLPLSQTRATSCYYFLSGVDVLTEEKNHALVCYGDSITAQAWPDELTLRLVSEGIKNVSVVRKATSGSRVLREYDNITYESYGVKGFTRFPREVNVAGVKNVIFQHGINDIIHPVGSDVNPFRPWSDLPSTEDLIAGLTFYADTAHKMGLKVWGGTLLPIYGWRTYAPFREELRNQINDWIKTTDKIDGVIDFDKAVCDEKAPQMFADGFDSGDHLHPSAKAYNAMAQIVPEEILK